jgi:hypothetical protein
LVCGFELHRKKKVLSRFQQKKANPVSTDDVWFNVNVDICKRGVADGSFSDLTDPDAKDVHGLKNYIGSVAVFNPDSFKICYHRVLYKGILQFNVEG